MNESNRTPNRPGRRGWRHAVPALLTAALTALCAACVAPDSSVAGQPSTLTQTQADAIVQELREIRRLLENMEKTGLAQAAPKPKTPTTARVSIQDGATLGRTDAPVTVVEFTDYQCPYCLRFVEQAFPKLKQDFIDTGKVRWVVRDMPLGFHQNARKAAQAARCAGEQNKFWEMREVLFANAKQLDADKLPSYGELIGLDTVAFDACLESERHLQGIDRSADTAGDAQITGTPTFVIGKADADWVEGNRLIGARDYRVFEEQIRKLLPN